MKTSTKCNIDNLDSALFCKNCGVELKKNSNDTIQTENVNIANANESENNIIYNIAWILVFIAFFIFIVWYYKMKENEQVTSTLAPVEVVQSVLTSENITSRINNTQTNNIEKVNSRIYNKYCNARFGFCLEYPSDLKTEMEPSNGDGYGWTDEYGSFKMSAYAGWNNDQISLNAHFQDILKDFNQVAYRKKGKNWFVISGYQDNKIVYYKVWVSKKCLNNYLRFEYPIESKKEYDDIVEYVVKSFKPNLECN